MTGPHRGRPRLSVGRCALEERSQMLPREGVQGRPEPEGETTRPLSPVPRPPASAACLWPKEHKAHQKGLPRSVPLTPHKCPAFNVSHKTHCHLGNATTRQDSTRHSRDFRIWGLGFTFYYFHFLTVWQREGERESQAGSDLSVQSPTRGSIPRTVRS